MKTLLIFTDTHSNQVNGVTRCIENLLENIGSHTAVHVVSATDFLTIPFLGYKEIRLSFAFPKKIYKIMKKIEPDFIHIMTEGPIGLTAAYICQRKKIPYTTTFHTKFPEYIHMRNRFVKESYVHQYLRYIHGASEKIFISNPGMKHYLIENKYTNMEVVPFGINHDLFFRGKKTLFLDEKYPILLYVGRIAVEKNIEDFLNIEGKYRKIVVGDGPLRGELEKKFPDTRFLGLKTPQELGEIYRSADVFIFPSKTDTLGLVNLEAIACGLPVVAYNIDNIRGIITHKKTGILVKESTIINNRHVKKALKLGSPKNDTVEILTWKNYADRFISCQFPISKNIWI